MDRKEQCRRCHKVIARSEYFTNFSMCRFCFRDWAELRNCLSVVHYDLLGPVKEYQVKDVIRLAVLPDNLGELEKQTKKVLHQIKMKSRLNPLSKMDLR